MTVGILGSGAWGTAIAYIAAQNQASVTMWARESEVVDEINSQRSNERFLSGVVLPESVRATSEVLELAGCDVLVNATPTQYVRSTFRDDVAKGAIVVNLAKGIERGTHLRVSEVIAHTAPSASSFVVLSGPSHAEEVVRNMPTTVVCAGRDRQSVSIVQKLLMTPTFRVYASDDVVGVEIGGALKNVIAIAAGIVDGLGMGDNTKAALITRGLAEISRLGVALGADPQTLYGLAGLGDLFVTCTSRHSRNRAVGERIGRGETLDQILGSMSAVAEGVPTTQAALELAADVGVELPITERVSAILWQGADPEEAVRKLMMRPARDE
ncbi:MAG: NAD(P)-dependent glycerol-3-phosphate dehydrogenase [Candidatus Kapabacteria bacterium]|nr:NAD(P)-dependent glycerol-3-phosphate dehydrogenase [Candidatus Kapabacteria bacterium]